MAVQIPFPLPSTGYALNSKIRVNLDFLVAQFNQFNTGSATWDVVAIGIANNETGTLTFYNSSNANYLTFQAGATAANTTFTWPTGVPSTTHKFLTSDTSGVMSWSQISETAASYAGNLLLYMDASRVIQELAIGSGNKVLVNSSPPSYASLTGTSNQVTVTPSAGAFTFSLPQSIDTAASVQFGTLKLGAGSNASPALFFASSSSNLVGLYTDGTGTTLDIHVGSAISSPVWSLDSSGNVAATGETRSVTFRATTNYQLSTSTSKILTMQMTTGGSADYTINWPASQASGATVLKNDGSGNLTWVSISSAGGATTALDNLSSVAVNSTIKPGTNSSLDFGSSTKNWVDIYFTGKLMSGSTTLATNTEVGYLTGVTSAIQTQFGLKAPLASPTFTGTVTVPGLSSNGNITFSSPATQGIVGTTTNNSAAAGNVGEYIEATFAGVAAATTDTYKDATSFTLTAGDWDITVLGVFDAGGGTGASNRIGVSTTSGNSSTGLVLGKNAADMSLSNPALGTTSASVSNYRVSIAGSTTYYFKWFADYSSGSPTLSGRISARRVR